MEGHTFVSLYAGAGGLDRGFIEAGFRCLWANDVDADAVHTHRLNLGGEAVRGDIAEIGPEPIKDLSPDVIVGGPPCQGFSVAGHMQPNDPRSQHVRIFMNTVSHVKPAAFVMENVAALALNRRWSHVIRSLRAQAENDGYSTALWVLNASHYGVAQARMRMFLVGVRGAAPLKPDATTASNPPTVRDVLAMLPDYGEPGNSSKCRAIVTPARRPVLRKSPYAGMLFNGKGRTLNLDAPAPTLPASMGGNRTPVVDQDQLEGRAGECWIVGYHARLWAGRAPNQKIPRRMRRLTVEEAAAIQSFPSDWVFHGTQSSQFRQIGNAVPPALAFHVATSLRDAMAAATAPSLELVA